MSTFNEDNTVEQLLISAAKKSGWRYVPASDIPRLQDEVLVIEWLMDLSFAIICTKNSRFAA